MDADALALIEDLRSEGVHDVEAFRQAFEDRLLSETDVTIDRVRDAMPTDAADATDFVGDTLRTLRTDLTAAVDEREETVASEFRETLADARDAVDQAVEAVDDIALHLSLARFALEYDCTRPIFVTGKTRPSPSSTHATSRWPRETASWSSRSPTGSASTVSRAFQTV